MKRRKQRWPPRYRTVSTLNSFLFHFVLKAVQYKAAKGGFETFFFLTRVWGANSHNTVLLCSQKLICSSTHSAKTHYNVCTTGQCNSSWPQNHGGAGWPNSHQARTMRETASCDLSTKLLTLPRPGAFGLIVHSGVFTLKLFIRLHVRSCARLQCYIVL